MLEINFNLGDNNLSYMEHYNITKMYTGRKKTDWWAPS